MFEFFDILQSQTVPLFWAGAALIVVNVITHAAIDRYEQRRKDREKVASNLKPLLRATSDPISRISEILIIRNPSLVSAVSNIGLDTSLRGWSQFVRQISIAMSPLPIGLSTFLPYQPI